jgi:hypothetical protein
MIKGNHRLIRARSRVFPPTKLQYQGYRILRDIDTEHRLQSSHSRGRFTVIALSSLAKCIRGTIPRDIDRQRNLHKDFAVDIKAYSQQHFGKLLTASENLGATDNGDTSWNSFQ